MTVIRGMQAVHDALKLEEYPATKQDINYAVGDIEVEDAKGGYLPVRMVLDNVGQSNFTNAEEVVSALQKAIQKTAA